MTTSLCTVESEPVNAVAKAITVLQALRRLPEGASARQLATVVDLPRSTVQRILTTLAGSGMVVQGADHQRYQIGPQALLIGLGYQQGLDLVSVARPHMLRVRDSTGETVGLSVRVGDARVFIEEEQSRQQLRFASELGRQYPLWSGASGRILMTALNESEVAAVLDDQAHVSSVFRAVDRDEREGLLEAARRDGYATARNETIENISSVAVPVLDRIGRLAGALSVSGPTSRITDERMEEIRRQLADAADRIAAGLGRGGI